MKIEEVIPGSGYRHFGNLKTAYRAVYIDKKLKLVHIALAEKALGRNLPKGAVVHHVNRNGEDNCPGNLVILQNAQEHRSLHASMRIVDCGGDPKTQRVCSSCGLQPKGMFTNEKQTVCRVCLAKYMRTRRAVKKLLHIRTR